MKFAIKGRVIRYSDGCSLILPLVANTPLRICFELRGNVDFHTGEKRGRLYPLKLAGWLFELGVVEVNLPVPNCSEFFFLDQIYNVSPFPTPIIPSCLL